MLLVCFTTWSSYIMIKVDYLWGPRLSYIYMLCLLQLWPLVTLLLTNEFAPVAGGTTAEYLLVYTNRIFSHCRWRNHIGILHIVYKPYTLSLSLAGPQGNT